MSEKNPFDIPINDPRIEQYLKELSPENDPLLIDMEQHAAGRGFPIVDRLVGRLLYVITRLKRPGLIVELGSGFGYSAYWFSRAMDGGRIVLTDRSEENLARAKDTFQRAGFTADAEFRNGEALETAEKYQDIDILFIDLDKKQYPEAVRTLKGNLAPGALVIADNSLWYGRVASKEPTPETMAVREFNEMMANDPEFFTTIVPVRDGVMLALRL